MLTVTNTTYLDLGFTETSPDLALVEREAMRVAAHLGLPVAIWLDDDGYTGFVVEGDMAAEFAKFRGCPTELVKVVGATGELNADLN